MEITDPYYSISISSADEPTAFTLVPGVIASDLDPDAVALAVASAIHVGKNATGTVVITRYDQVNTNIPFPPA